MEQLHEFFGGPLGGALLALAGVVVGGVLEGRRQRIAFERQRNWERGQMRHRRLEELALACKRVEGALEDAALHMLLGSDDEPAPEPNDRHREIGDTELPRIQMLVYFYLPELAEIANAIHQPYWRTGGVYSGRKWVVARAGKAQEEASAAIGKLRDEAAQLARRELGLD